MLYWMQKFIKILLKFGEILTKFDKDWGSHGAGSWSARDLCVDAVRLRANYFCVAFNDESRRRADWFPRAERRIYFSFLSENARSDFRVSEILRVVGSWWIFTVWEGLSGHSLTCCIAAVSDEYTRDWVLMHSHLSLTGHRCNLEKSTQFGKGICWGCQWWEQTTGGHRKSCWTSYTSPSSLR